MSSVLSLNIASTNIEFTSDNPKIPPVTRMKTKYNFEKKEIAPSVLAEICSSISYQPSTVNILNIE